MSLVATDGSRRATGRTLGFTLEFMHVPALDRERETPANRKSRVLRQKTSPEKMRKVELREIHEFVARLWPLLRRLRPHRNPGGDLLQIANDDLVAGPHSLVNDHQLALVGTG
jgi:hypothetical protein